MQEPTNEKPQLLLNCQERGQRNGARNQLVASMFPFGNPERYPCLFSSSKTLAFSTTTTPVSHNRNEWMNEQNKLVSSFIILHTEISANTLYLRVQITMFVGFPVGRLVCTPTYSTVLCTTTTQQHVLSCFIPNDNKL